MRRFFKGVGSTVVAVLAAILAACGDGGPQAQYDEYLTRLSRTLSVSQGTAHVSRPTPMPAPRELRLELASSDLDMLDFLAMTGCEVQVTIGKRNSSLGRLAQGSQRLLLDLEYLQLAPTCIDYQREQGDTALADTLEQAWMLKQQQLAGSIYQATLAGPEFRAFWKPGVRANNYPANTGSRVITSLEKIHKLANRWLLGDFNADTHEFEALLASVATGDGGTLRQALAEQADALVDANALLLARRERGPLCAPPIRDPAADILPNVVRAFFIEGIQPRASALNRRYHELLPSLTALENALDTTLPRDYKAWQQLRDSQVTAWLSAPRAHVAEILAIQRPCGNAPGSRG